MRILLVQDDDRDIEALMECFQGEPFGARVVVARSGDEAVEHLHGVRTGSNSHRPHLIVLELLVAGTSGLDVLRRLKEHPGTRLIPVVVLTRSRDPGHVVESYQLGVNSYIVKPEDDRELRDTLRTLREYWTRHNEPPSL
ncbi:MAG TPA: response regulator [Candidatus Eisenbacteria bacterium]|nr:response regulator [Candidatus Eisenbacteria bacterium]